MQEFATIRDFIADRLILRGNTAKGISNHSGEVTVDTTSRTNAENIRMVADVTDRGQLNPVAIREGHASADSEFGDQPWNTDRDYIATAVFSQPEVGTFDISEADAKEHYGDVRTFWTKFRSMKQILSGDESRVMMKVAVRASDDRVLRCTYVRLRGSRDHSGDWD